MKMKRCLYIWLSDTHFSISHIGRFFSFIRKVKKENPDGIFLTGDISEGFVWIWLELAAKYINCPIYFVLGNHCYHKSSFNQTILKIKNLCQRCSNLIWMEDQNEPIKLADEVCLIGAGGWYSADKGNISYLNWTLDWILIKELRELPNLQARVEYYRALADKSAILIKERLEKALEQDYKTIYILTHVPPFAEATRDEGTFMEPYWLPYNVNYRMGEVIKEMMKDRNKRNVIVAAGHSHNPEYIRISRNISCQVGRPCNSQSVNSQIIYV